MKTTVRFTTCAHFVHRSELFTSLQLDMNQTLNSPDEHVQSHFQNEEGLSDYKCRNVRCNFIGTCNKQLELLQWPRVLLVHFKRWQYNEPLKFLQHMDLSPKFVTTSEALLSISDQPERDITLHVHAMPAMDGCILTTQTPR